MIDGGTGIHHVGTGLLTGREIIAEMARISAVLEQPELVTHGLIDLTAVTELRVSSAEIMAMTGIDTKLSEVIKRARVAIVAPDDLVFGVSMMYAGHMGPSPWTIEVFRRKDLALAWLGSRPSEGPEPAV
jgi:hypothetical protein